MFVIPPPATPPVDPDVLQVKESDLKVSEGKVELKVGAGTKGLRLPASLSAMTADRNIAIDDDAVSVEIPGQVADQLKGLLSAEQLKDATFSFAFVPVTSEKLRQTLKQADQSSDVRIRAQESPCRIIGITRGQ